MIELLPFEQKLIIVCEDSISMIISVQLIRQEFLYNYFISYVCFEIDVTVVIWYFFVVVCLCF